MLFFCERGAGAFDKERDHVQKVAALFVDFALALAAGAALYDLEDALELVLAAEVLGVGVRRSTRSRAMSLAGTVMPSRRRRRSRRPCRGGRRATCSPSPGRQL